MSKNVRRASLSQACGEGESADELLDGAGREATTSTSDEERIVRGECDAGGCPRPPTIEYYDQFPLTTNDVAVTDVVSAAFAEHFGQDRVAELAPLTGSEDFSIVPDAFGIPYTFWTIGGFPADAPPIPNHNPRFAPVLHPTLETGTEAAVTAVLAHLSTGG